MPGEITLAELQQENGAGDETADERIYDSGAKSVPHVVPAHKQGKDFIARPNMSNPWAGARQIANNGEVCEGTKCTVISMSHFAL